MRAPGSGARVRLGARIDPERASDIGTVPPDQHPHGAPTNQWVANETIEDFALRFTARRARKWSPARVANTAIGSISFLALEAIGGAITISYGFENAVAAILVVGAILFLTALPISYYAARYGVDIDLLTRGAGFGYIGSTFTSLIYASFTFIFFALEASILSIALDFCFGVPLAIGYLLNALIVIPLVTHGFTRISIFQKWTQPLWLVLQAIPFLFLIWMGGDLEAWLTHEGRLASTLDLLAFAAAAGVAFSLVAQVGEQVDFLRFLPEPTTRRERLAWWGALLAAGPGWAVIGTLKMLAGSLLAVIAIGAGIGPENAMEPTHMYYAVFGAALPWESVALFVTGLFVIICQLKINVTNAYAGSIAWSNFFSRLTHSHPGRVVWLVFNIVIALMLMEFGVFGALEATLGLYAHVAAAWIGALVADLVINKPLGLSPKGIEFRRAYLYDINPVGVGATVIATLASLAAYLGLLGPTPEALSCFIALGSAIVLAPAIALGTQSAFYIARPAPPQADQTDCGLCGYAFDAEDIVGCPFHSTAICSLCCSLDARCNDRCKTEAKGSWWPRLPASEWLPHRSYAQFLGVVSGFLVVIGLAFLLIRQQLALTSPESDEAVLRTLVMAFAILTLIIGVAAWLHVLARESAARALGEEERQSHRLAAEIEAHKRTDEQLQKAKEDAEAANEAKSRYVIGLSHELRTPLNAMLGYAELMEDDPTIPAHRRPGVSVIRRSAEHLSGLIEGLLDISGIEAGRLEVFRDQIRSADFLSHIAAVFRMQAIENGLDFTTDLPPALPEFVYGDEKRLRQILMNLLSNAIRYTDTGEVRFTVRYSSEIATFTVTDTGRGIPEEEIERIFRPFERIETPDAPVRGTGLGLTITKLLTEMLGGELTLESEVGQGSTFRVRLMLPRVYTGPSLVKTIERPVQGYGGARRRILVVDDNPEHRALLRDALQPLGFEMAFAETGEIAEMMVGEIAPDLTLVDVALPGIDGWTLLRRLRERHGVKTPIFVVSAHAHHSRAGQAAEGLMDAFIAKPVKIGELIRLIGTRLQLDWLYEAPRSAPTILPPESLLAGIRAAAEINHAAGVRAALNTIADLDPAYAPFVERADALLQQFDFDGLRRLSGEAAA